MISPRAARPVADDPLGWKPLVLARDTAAPGGWAVAADDGRVMVAE